MHYVYHSPEHLKGCRPRENYIWNIYSYIAIFKAIFPYIIVDKVDETGPDADARDALEPIFYS